MTSIGSMIISATSRGTASFLMGSMPKAVRASI
jgi:hypothetical protein